MRRAPIPHAACGEARVCGRRRRRLRLVRALVLLSALPSLLTLVSAAVDGAGSEHASSAPPHQESFSATSRAASSGRRPRSISAQPLYLQADQLLYDTKNNRVIAQGNVEIYYNNYILTADQVIYDQSRQQADRRGQRPAEGPQRQHHAGPTASRRSTISATPSSSRSAWSPPTTRASPPSAPAAARATSPSTSAASSRPARTIPACRRCGASAPPASFTISVRPPSPTRMRSSSCSACRCSTCPTSSTPTPR